MSKAFTSEESDEDAFAIEPPGLPPGVRNYMTKAGAERMKAELQRHEAERQKLSADKVEDQSRQAILERRMRFLISRLETAHVIDPLAQPADQVLFGATVTVEDAKGRTQDWRIVGIDEMDLDRGWISWMSPLATVFLGKRPGETAVFQKASYKIVSIRYDA